MLPFEAVEAARLVLLSAVKDRSSTAWRASHWHSPYLKAAAGTVTLTCMVPALLVSTALDVAWLVHSKRQSVCRGARHCAAHRAAQQQTTHRRLLPLLLLLWLQESLKHQALCQQLLMGVPLLACKPGQRNLLAAAAAPIFVLTESGPKPRLPKTAVEP